MSRRHVLEDSDSDDDDKAPISSDFFTAEEKEVIAKCEIQVNPNGGKYTEDLMSRAIARVGEPPLEITKEGGSESYEGHCVKKGHEKSFFEREIYKVHKGEGYSSGSPSEETILFEIEVIRRSGKATKNRMFKNKETGGMVVFGPWWNYSMQRVLDLSSDKTLTAESFGQYTAVKIIRSLFSLIAIGLKDIVKAGHLTPMIKKMGVDWKRNTETARRILNQWGPNHFLDKELLAVEDHVKSLVKKPTKSVPAANAKPTVPASTTTGASSKAVSTADLNKKRTEAAKARLKAMRDNARQKPASMYVGEVTTIPAPKKAAAAPTLGGAGSFAQGGDAARNAESRSRQNDGHVQKYHSESANDGHGKDSYSQPSSRGGQLDARNTSRGTPLQDTRPQKNNDGWGRNRDRDDEPQPVKPKGSWQFARRTLGINIPVRDKPHQGSSRQEAWSQGGAPDHAPAAARDNVSSRDDHSRDLNRGCEYDSRGGGTHLDPRSDNNPSRHSDNRPSDRYDQRSLDRRGDYSRGNSRGEDYGRGSSGGGEYRHSGSRDGSSRDYGGSSRYDHDRDGRDNPPQKRFKPHESSAPTVSVPAPARGAGRGRGADINKPAWLVQKEQGKGPTGMPRNENGFTSAGPAAAPAARVSSNHTNAASGDPSSMPAVAPSVSHASGGRGGSAGGGRGAEVNKPAWLVEKEPGNGPTGMPNNSVSTNPHQLTPSLSAPSGADCVVNNMPSQMPSSSMAAPMGRASGGRGRGTDNRPAWMVRQDEAPTSVPAVMQHQAPVPIANLNAQAPNPSRSVGGLTSTGRGRGRGRGRGKNLPAWMTNPPNP